MRLSAKQGWREYKEGAGKPSKKEQEKITISQKKKDINIKIIIEINKNKMVD